jgi:hypothetical protein
MNIEKNLFKCIASSIFEVCVFFGFNHIFKLLILINFKLFLYLQYQNVFLKSLKV